MAPSAPRRTSVSSTPVVSAVAPQPGLSCVSHSTTGREAVRAIAIASRTPSCGRDHRHGELGLLQCDLAGERVGGAVGGLLAPGVGDDGGPAPVEVGGREAREVGQVDEVAVGDDRAGDDALGGLDHRALVVERDQEGQLAQRAAPGPAALEQQRQGAGGMLAGLGPVDVRIGAVADEAVGRLHHLRRDVGVVVEADGDRHVRARRRRARGAAARPRRPRTAR